METEKLGVLIAERELDLLSSDGNVDRKVLIKLGKPRKVPRRSIYRCHYQIIGIGDEKVRYGESIDGMDALLLALTKIGADLYNSDEALSKRLSWMGDQNLGLLLFVTSENSLDLVPAPAYKLLM